MRIVKLTAENIKKLVAVEITPTGDLVTISGANGQGKTSILDALWWALSGTAGIQAQPIRKGQNKAKIRLDMGELIVERKFTPSGSTLIVENAEGSRFSSPQKMLDELLGALSFDPLEFARMKPREQFDELRRITPLDVDLDELDRANKADFDKRTDINRQAKAKRFQAEAIVAPAVILDLDIDETAIIDQMESAAERNQTIEQRRQRRAKAEQTVKDSLAEVQRLRAKGTELRAQADALDTQAAEAETAATELQQTIDEAEPLPDPVDITSLRTKLDEARAVNKDREKLRQRQDLETEAEKLEAEALALTEGIEARRMAKTEAISKAQMPVVGLHFGDGIVLYQGVPFDQASSAEQLRVSLSIAMASNPKIRVIRIQDGSLLDSESMQHIEDMARAHDYQVWVEVVSTSGKLGIVIEEGAVVAVNE